jgi:hypothetical protein
MIRSGFLKRASSSCTGIYRSDIDDELISVVSDFSVNGKTDNYDTGTIHQGIELEWLQGLSDRLITSRDNLSSKLVYNYPDFYFSCVSMKVIKLLVYQSI